MLIKKAKIRADILSDKVVLITGAGGGIGYEAARALAYLGADVVIAEINKKKGAAAQNSINNELSANRVIFYAVDLADEKQIDDLYSFIKGKYGCPDVIFNNATVTPMGAVDAVSVMDWDKSYAVNLKAPVLLAQKFLPDMKQRNSGVIVFVPSSGAAPYMGAYEVFKTAQVELCNTLSGELDGTNIFTYAIGPGLVKTETAQKAIETVSALMGMTITEFYETNEKHLISAEEAGVGFAVSVVNAEQYNGREIGSIQVLMDFGLFENNVQAESHGGLISDTESISRHMENIVRVYNEQYDGWRSRSLFERQWLLRDFKKTVGTAADNFQKIMEAVLELVKKQRFEEISGYKQQFENLKRYYFHQHKLLQGYEKNPQILEKNSKVILAWADELQTVINKL